ncbi:hypothetical protein DKX38_019795 [Salix brachista]|uniref:Uncharacterized protein n=1 Tax=Salix brachista TaxID=2182728 RepID=A0A5N5KHB7_9ROSI|nr:hypothetical protein DKX38_019795 [Salix brachista]
MATSFAPVSVSSAKSISFAKAPRLPIGRKSNLDGSSPMLAVRAKYKYAVLALDSCLIKSMSFDVTTQKLEFHAKKWPCYLRISQILAPIKVVMPKDSKTNMLILNCDGSRGGGSDFVAGFVLGGAVFGTLAYIFAPQIRRSLLNEDEYGFRRAKRPVYYDEGLEKTRQTLNAKISQLNSAIDKVSSRLRGGNNSPPVPLETDPNVEATM